MTVVYHGSKPHIIGACIMNSELFLNWKSKKQKYIKFKERLFAENYPLNFRVFQDVWEPRSYKPFLQTFSCKCSHLICNIRTQKTCAWMSLQQQFWFKENVYAFLCGIWQVWGKIEIHTYSTSKKFRQIILIVIT